MPDTNNTASVRTWLRRCPAIERARAFGVDYLAENGSYSLDATPTALKYRENILGEMVLRDVQEQNFVFASREPYGDAFQQNLDNLGVMQDVAAWIIDRNNARDFPDWEGGEVVGIVPTISGYPIAMGSAFARYQIQIKVTYRVTREQGTGNREQGTGIAAAAWIRSGGNLPPPFHSHQQRKERISMAETITGKIARKYMGHFLDASFMGETPVLYRLGKDLEEYNVEMNPNGEQKQNILGENTYQLSGYEVSSSAEPYYAVVGDALFEKLQHIIDTQATDDTLKTYAYEVHLWETGTSQGTLVAYRQECYVVPTSYGGDTTGYQIPFEVHYVGEKVLGNFTPASGSTPASWTAVN